MRHLAILIVVLLFVGAASASAAPAPGVAARASGVAAPAGVVAPGASGAEAPLPFVGQRALYKLTLTLPQSTSVVAGGGRMGFEVLDACEGWAVRQRLEMTLVSAEGGVTRMISDYATWEAKNGLSFRFHTLDMTNGEVTDRLTGEAHLTREGGPGEVVYSEPTHKTVALPAGTLFPMAQTEAIIRAARAGKKFMATPLFDGTDASGASWSSVAIEGWDSHLPADVESGFPALAGLPSTRVSVAFFNRKPSAMLPTFEIGLRYFLNGVADHLVLNFSGFSMQGRMVDLSILPSHC
ncbi:MAG: EipB family protein [Acetobacteraceae bacterium]